MQLILLIIFLPVILMVAILFSTLRTYLIILGTLALLIALFLQYALNIDVFGAFENFLKSNQKKKDERLNRQRNILRSCIIADLSDGTDPYVNFLRELKDHSYDSYRHQEVVTLDLFEIGLLKGKIYIKRHGIVYNFDEIKSILKDIEKQGRARIYINMTQYDIMTIPSESQASLYVEKLISLIDETLKLMSLVDKITSDLKMPEEKMALLQRSELEEDEIKKLAIKIEMLQYKKANTERKLAKNTGLIEKMAVPILTSNSDELLDRLNSQYLKIKEQGS